MAPRDVVDELESLVVRAQAGDVDAYGAIVRRFQDMAVAYGYAILGDYHLAEDAAQEAFLQAYAGVAALREPGAFAAWFRRVAFRQCDRIKRRNRVRVVPLSAAADLAFEGPDPSEVAEAHEMKEHVRRAAQALPESERTATTLFYISRYSQREIAEFLDVPVTTVNNRLHTARRRLQRSMLDMVRDHLQEMRPSRDDRFVQRLLRTLAPSAKDHSDKIYEVLEAKTVSGRSHWRAGRLAHSHFDWDASRIGLVDNRIVTVFGIYDVTMRIGTAACGPPASISNSPTPTSATGTRSRRRPRPR